MERDGISFGIRGGGPSLETVVKRRQMDLARSGQYVCVYFTRTKKSRKNVKINFTTFGGISRRGQRGWRPIIPQREYSH